MQTQLTWQQFRNNIKNQKFIHEGKEVTGWELPMYKQTKMYSELMNKRNTHAAYINSGVKNV
tara:strand:- start:89 stop:274 length:186 start_codon:yes stop_codon:yes gene_type:complete